MTGDARTPSDEFLRVYEDYVNRVAHPLEGKMAAILNGWRDDDYWADYTPFDEETEEDLEQTATGVIAVPRPIQNIKTRTKRLESALDKIGRMKSEFRDGESEASLAKMQDFVGGRVITYFPRHVHMVDREIRSKKDFVIVNEPRSYLSRVMMERLGLDIRKFTMKGFKPSGYASIHYFVRLVDTKGELGNTIVELQVRTMLEEVWAEVEHQLGYKRGQRTEFSVARQFRVISGHIHAIDDHFDYIYDRLSYLQRTSKPQEDDLLNAENLPSVLDSVECTCPQSAIDRLLTIMYDNGIRTVRDFNHRARHEIVEAVKSEYAILKNGDVASAFHLVSTINYLTPTSHPDEARTVLRTNLAMADLTERTRRRKKPRKS